MKYFSIFTILLLSISVFFISCGAESKNTGDSKIKRDLGNSVYVNEPPYNIWGWEKETRVGSWLSKSYKLQYDDYKTIQSPETCEEGMNCIHLHIGCNFNSSHTGKQFGGYIMIERHPDHPKTPLPFIVPSYSSKATVWLNGVQFDAELNRSSLVPAFIYGMGYHWTVEMSRELFDAIKTPVEQLTFQIKTDDDKIKAAAVFQFHLSKTYKHVKFMTDNCPRP